MNETKLSSEAIEGEASKSAEDIQGAKNGEKEEFDELDDADDGVAGDAGGEFGGNKQRSELPPIEAQSVTLDSVPFSETHLSPDLATSSQHLSDVPVDYDVLQPLEWTKFKDQVEVSELSTPLSVANESAQSHLHNQIQSSGCLTFSSNLSPTSVTESISSGSHAFPDQKLSPITNTSDNTVLPEGEQQSSFKPFKPKRSSSAILVKTPSADGFNWRKYGQKQVKVPQGSRSYYKCTYSDCHAKKIERNDHLNNVIEVISKGEHNHDPLPKATCKHNHVLPTPPHIHQEGFLKESEPPLSSGEPIQEALALPEQEQLNFSGSYEIVAVDVKEEHSDEPEPKKRLKKCNSLCPGSQVKSSKKQKIVVHAASDVSVSGDGYRWRKYGQKMVKGKPHPRNYYRCTSAGCPVRKHLERAVDDTSGFIITYKGVHDHDMPVPKKGQSPPSAPLVAAAAAEASMNSLQVEKKDEESVDNQVPAIQWTVEDTGGELIGDDDAMDAEEEEKAVEPPTHTLVGIGFEIKQC